MMLQLNHEIPKTVYTYTPYTLQEFTDAFLKNKPKGIWIKAWSSKKPLYELKDYAEDGVSVRCETSVDPNFDFYTWEHLYSYLKNYLCPSEYGSPVEIEKFKCFEMHVSSRFSSTCSTQCEECALKESKQ